MSILNIFRKKKSNEENKEEQITPTIVEETESTFTFSFFNMDILTSFPTDKETIIDDLIKDLNFTLENNKQKLLEASIHDAIEFMEWTGESFHIMFDAEDTPEEAQEFVDAWNLGDNNVYIDFMSRWFSKEHAMLIADDIRKFKPTCNSLEELQLQSAQSILNLNLEKYNFANIYLAISEDLSIKPETILKYMTLTSAHLSFINDVPVWILCFICDWEIEHGIDWIIKKDIPVYVGADGLSVSDDEVLSWNKLHTNSH